MSLIEEIIKEKEELSSINQYPDLLLISDALWASLRQEEAWCKVVLCGESGDLLSNLEVVIFEQESNPFLRWSLCYKEKLYGGHHEVSRYELSL